MSRREDIDNAIWSDPEFEALSLEATALYLWSFTNPRCGMAGIYKVSHRAMTESKVPEDRLPAALEELTAARFAFYADGVLFVRTRVKHMRQKTEQIAKSIRSDVQKIGDDHPMKTAWIRENGSAPWLLRHLTGDPQWSLDRLSSDSQGVPALAGNSGGSLEGHSTLKGKGKGKGTGKGPLGRGPGRGNPPAAELQFRAWAADHFPAVPIERLALVARQLHEDGLEVNVETVGARLAETHPERLGGRAA